MKKIGQKFSLEKLKKLGMFSAFICLYKLWIRGVIISNIKGDLYKFFHDDPAYQALAHQASKKYAHQREKYGLMSCLIFALFAHIFFIYLSSNSFLLKFGICAFAIYLFYVSLLFYNAKGGELYSHREQCILSKFVMGV